MSSATGSATDHKADDDKPTVITRKVSECPVSTVTVFRDRAEVTRRIVVEPEAPGLFDVVMEEVTSKINEDSIRVKGTGHVTILEVSFAKNIKPIEPEGGEAAGDAASAEDRAKALHVKATELQDRRRELDQARNQVNKTIKLMDDYADRVMSHGIASKPSPAAGAGAGGVVTEVLDLEFVDKLLDAHAARMEAADKRRNEIDREVREVDKEVSAVQAQLHALGRAGRPRTRTTNDVTVSINATAPGEVVLFVTYQVSDASWSPSYDVRINSKDSTLELSYFGLVNQTTDEDWESTRIVLSTAEPAVGGVPPVLTTKHVRFERPKIIHASMERAMPQSRRMRHASRGAAASFQLNMQAQMFSESATALDEDEGEEEAPPLPQATTATAKVERSGASATFAIERPATIHTDNKPHKVTVAIISLRSAFRYYAAPALSEAAYLQALTRNTSDFPLLASAKVNVFLDGSFVSTTSINNVSPGESFRNFLGVDPAVRVTYRPVNRHRATKGSYFTGRSEAVTYTHLAIVKNTKATPISLVVADMLPKSDDERIKVVPVEPSPAVLEAGSKAEEADSDEAATAAAARGDGDDSDARDTARDVVAQNKITNNVVWNRQVAAGATSNFELKYVVEFPPDSKIEIA
mmetsp:Transcript_3858/g.10588  ORF Transcript_3858/g.10588 Transcript_3858/m.10588 type:complete len:638 (-) Transcript_3858:297-2210(-)